MMGAVLYFFGDIVVGLFGGILLEMTRILNKDRHATPVVIGWLTIVGGVVGALSAALVGWRLSPEVAFVGASLVATPILVGGATHVLGRLRGNRDELSHLATWYGGASIGFGLAAGRFAVLRAMGQV